MYRIALLCIVLIKVNGHGPDQFPSASFREIVGICQKGVYMLCRP